MPEVPAPLPTVTTTHRRLGGHLALRPRALMLMAAISLVPIAQAGADRVLTFGVTAGQIGGVNTAEVHADGIVVVRLRSTNGNGLVEKAETIADRLTELALGGLKPEQVEVTQLAGEWGVSGAGTLIITADAATAKASGLAPRALCESWRKRLAAVLAEPYLCIDPEEQLVVPYGEQRAIRFGGTVTPQPKIESMAPGIAEVERRAGRALVRGVGDGATVVLFESGELEHAITVVVKRWAAQIAASAALNTLPAGVPEPMTMPALLNAALTAVKAEPRATVRLAEWVPTDSGYNVLVRAGGAEYLPVMKTLPVSVRKGAAAIPVAQSLLISNAPEKVDGTGALMRQALKTNVASRLMWHHKNYVGRPIVLAIRLVNAGEQPARIRLGWAQAGPDADEIFVGFNAMVRYWKSVRAGAGFLATLPPRSTFETSAIRMDYHDVVSGLMDLVADSGEHLYVEVVSRDPEDAPSGFGEVPGEGVSLPVTPYEFPANLDAEVDYEVGGRYGHLSIGREAVQNEQGVALAGAYGISHRVRVNASNPTEQPAVLELALRSGGGIARTVTMVGDTLNCSGNLGAGNEQILERRDLPPGVSMTIPLEIIPTAGSNLPFTLVVRARTR